MKYDRSIHNNFLKVNNRLEKILKITFLKIMLYLFAAANAILYMHIIITTYINNIYILAIIAGAIAACIILNIKCVKITNRIKDTQLKIISISGSNIADKYFKNIDKLNKTFANKSNVITGYDNIKMLMKDVEKSVSVLPKAYQDEARYVYLKNWFEHKAKEQDSQDKKSYENFKADLEKQ